MKIRHPILQRFLLFGQLWSFCSWRKLNKANILIDGIKYSTNGRGANIVIIDAETFEVIDSVVYDTHEPQDNYRRIKTV